MTTAPPSQTQTHQQFATPTTRLLNQLLWGDWKSGSFGILSRSFDGLTPDFDPSQNDTLQAVYFPGKTKLLYYPASFVHASTRAPNAIYPPGWNRNWRRKRPACCAVLVGSQYRRNSSMNSTRKNIHETVDAVSFYAADAGSYKRGALVNASGTGCVDVAQICCNGKCIVNPADRDHCTCDYNTVPGASHGNCWSKYVQQLRNGSKLDGLTMYTCSFPNSEQGIREMVDASNSLWNKRRHWSMAGQQGQYQGWTEAIAMPNINSPEMIDAIAIILPSNLPSNGTLSDFSQEAIDFLWDGLNSFMTLNETYRLLPIVIMKQTLGMNSSECAQFWGGVRCHDGYRKEFFSQAINFSNGACVGVPNGCHDAYYFPADNSTGLCMLFNSNASQVCGLYTRHDYNPVELHVTRNDGMSPFLVSTVGDTQFMHSTFWLVTFLIQEVAMVIIIWMIIKFFRRRRMKVPRRRN